MFRRKKSPYDEIAALEAVRAAALEAVRALVPILPLTGAPRYGYRLAATVALRGSPDEVRRAALAVANLNQVARRG